ncbi:hypothetical protein A9Q84_06140 [Halobacteriovorax marinus]|uniref:Cholesterol oxidase n=1 Tax=Halobacteriovorax marinus TaxID=97084 RepID=A0A1Y5F9R6_9BACT|nr:hypothetical protein A9Q84_06140 [Halobacteriovorax marinus]
MKEYDFVIVGSGFGGSVSACRLAQKGYSVAILEKGRHYSKQDFPKTNWDIKKYLWAPIIRCFGIQSITVLKNLMVLHGVGVGGGSLVYANTLLRPLAKIFKSTAWPSSINWEEELEPYYSKAEKMLGVCQNPHLDEGEEVIEQLSIDLGCHETFERTNVGVFFNDKPGFEVEDPYFNGSGPKRTGCTVCGSCMIGCPVGAKNTLDLNYLFFAKKWGSEIFAETTVDKIEPTSSGYLVHTICTTSLFRKKKTTFKAKKVILSAGVMGTMDILFKNKIKHRTLNNLSNRLGETIRTNGESLLGVTSFDTHRQLSKGIAIGAQIKPDEHTKIEGVRYPSGSDFMKLLTIPLTGGANRFFRPFMLLAQMVRRFIPYMKAMFKKDWANSSIILLVMQSLETNMTFTYGRTFFKGFSFGLIGEMKDEKMKTYIPIAQESAKLVAKNINGEALNCSAEVVLGSITTAHVLGGAVLAIDSNSGLVDTNHEVFGHKGLYICDASVIPANLAVNPSLTISALAERFSDQFPIKENFQELVFTN